MSRAARSSRLSSTERLLASLRTRFRASEIWFIALAIVVGGLSGSLTVLLSTLAHGLQSLLFGIGDSGRLSAAADIPLWNLVWLPAGGLVLGVSMWALKRWRPRNLVDVVEANALHGGRLSLRDSVIVCTQTLVSNGCGASVGLEAAYAQAAGAVASRLGQLLNLRRQDLRTMVGAGAGAAIGAAFGAPLTGAFYAFEIVIGSYAPSMIAPVAAATLTSVLAAQMLGSTPYLIDIAVPRPPVALDYLFYSVLGAICAAVGIIIVKLVGRVDLVLRRLTAPIWARPAIGGVILAGLAAISPQTLSSGHGALHLDLVLHSGFGILAFIFATKLCASVVALGFGFRGGLFFASLFLGSLLGQMYLAVVLLVGLPVTFSPESVALVGMGALAVAVVGGPLTMSFLVLEITQDFSVAAATLAASLIASSLVRERFGYSFSTWRLHLRGETIRSARDVGWMRQLTAGRMMRPDVSTISDAATIAEFRRRFPLGATSRVIAVDDGLRYAGIIQTASAYAEGLVDSVAVRSLATGQDVYLPPEANIKQVMELFDRTETEELAVVDAEHKVLGLLAETYVSRRYAKELEKLQLGLFGEDRAS